MNKFVENAIAKQEDAYKTKYACRAFQYSCSLCGTRNLLRIPCELCPIKEAHKRAIEEINSGLRVAPVRRGGDMKISYSRDGIRTLVLIETSEDVEVQIKRR